MTVDGFEKQRTNDFLLFLQFLVEFHWVNPENPENPSQFIRVSLRFRNHFNHAKKEKIAQKNPLNE